MKKLLTVLLACLLLMAALPAMADNVRTSGPYTYEIKGNGTITITDFDWSQNEGDIFIPNMIDGYTVTAIGDEAINRRPSSKERISITLPGSITSIGDFAFSYNNLGSINIPESLISVGKGAFMCNVNCQFVISPNHENFAVIENALYNKSKKELVACNYSTYNYIIPEGILSIAPYAMYQKGGGGVNLPSTLKSIGDYACYGMNIYVHPSSGFFPEGLESIGESAFMTTKFSSFGLYIPDSLKTLGKAAFCGVCHENSNQELHIYFGADSLIHHIPDEAFKMADVTVHHKGKINSIGVSAFEGHYANINVDSFDNITFIGEKAFLRNPWLTDKEKCNTIMQSLSPEFTVIPKHFCVRGRLPDTVEVISSQAFPYQVKDFYLPASVEDIATDAFLKGSTFVVEAGSYAEFWCSENGFGYTLEGQDALDWLN